MRRVMMQRALALVVLCGALCCLTSCVASDAAATTLSSSSLMDSAAAPDVWMTTPAPTLGRDVEFPPNSVTYQRREYKLPPQSFLLSHWYVGIIIIVVAVLLAYVALAIWVCVHFQYWEQRKAKKVVEAAYATHGRFDLEEYAYSGITTAHPSSRRQSGATAVTAVSGTASHSRDGGYDDSFGSYSDSYDDSSPRDSDCDDEDRDADAVVNINPLQRR